LEGSVPSSANYARLPRLWQSNGGISCANADIHAAGDTFCTLSPVGPTGTASFAIPNTYDMKALRLAQKNVARRQSVCSWNARRRGFQRKSTLISTGTTIAA
jgi:hypothetical protein